MECTVYDPQKGRLVTLDIEFTDDNTTQFYSRRSDCVTMIADCEGGLLIKSGYDYPMYIYDVSRGDIGFSRNRAEKLKRQYL
jgi:hypothetical protein